MLEYVPETVYRVARHFTKAKLTIPIIYVKVGRQAGCWAQAHKARGFGPSCLWGFPRSPSVHWSLEATCSLSPYPRDGACQTQGLTESGRQADWAGEAARHLLGSILGAQWHQ